MPQYLIIFANPNHAGHGGYILNKLKEKLAAAKHPYSVLDLYQEKYNPVLKLEECSKGLNRLICPDTLVYQEKIKKADKLIFIYPIWWQYMPAILKGFLDRTLTSGFAFKYSLGRPQALLRGKRAAIFCSTASTNKYIFKFKQNSASNFLSRNILNYCGISTKNFILGNARKLEDNKLSLEKIANRIITYLK
ncbi:MAG: flavodoxin family protein [Clostridia bacterium]|nr:flavodoxin family protein [Clostridia bacterium]